MSWKISVIAVLLLALAVLTGCPPGWNYPKASEPWMHAKLDTPDYFWEKDFFSNFQTVGEIREDMDTATKNVNDQIGQFTKYGLLGAHPLVFNPLISKGQKSDLSGSFSGSSGGLLGGYMSGSVEGKSRQAVSCVFCWSLPASDGQSTSTFISSLPCERIVCRLQEQGSPTIRFKYNIGELTNLYSWAYENPGILINEDQVLYATVSISRDQLKQGYLGLR